MIFPSAMLVFCPGHTQNAQVPRVFRITRWINVFQIKPSPSCVLAAWLCSLNSRFQAIMNIAVLSTHVRSHPSIACNSLELQINLFGEGLLRSRVWIWVTNTHSFSCTLWDTLEHTESNYGAEISDSVTLTGRGAAQRSATSYCAVWETLFQ